MKSLLTLSHIQVENANAIAGMTWGFPGISNFLGFTHALSRKLNAYAGLTLGSCAVICHNHHVQAHRPGGRGDYVFSLTRNPLTKDAISPSFVEEGRMHMDVSLIIECNFNHSQLDFDLEFDDDEAQVEHLTDWVHQRAVMHRLAGGTITALKQVEYDPVPIQDSDLAKFERKKLMRLLPGYLLVDRNEVLRHHHEDRVKEDKDATLLDSWLDFIAIKHRALPADNEAKSDEQEKAQWERLPKPESGWLVPIATGYTAISPLYQPGEVQRARDDSTPFRYVESVYSIGQWISPHRITEFSSIFWHYQQVGDAYLCVNNFQL